jgi:hypothetical protein
MATVPAPMPIPATSPMTAATITAVFLPPAGGIGCGGIAGYDG